MNQAARRRFIIANTAQMAPPHVPEIVLHLADEAHDLWHRTEEELASAGLPPPFWAFAWAGGQGLARYLIDHPDAVSGKNVLDFATGSGLVAIAAAKAGARHVLASDVDPFSAATARLNIELNDGGAITVSGQDLIGHDQDWDVVLAGDVFYDRELAERLLPWFSALRARGAEIFVGDPGRAYLPDGGMDRLAVYQVPVTRALEDTDIKKTTVWRLT